MKEYTRKNLFVKGHVGYKHWLGKKRPDVAEKLKITLKGKPVAIKNGVAIRSRGERNNKWKGDEVGYHGIHEWLSRYFGEPKKCEECGIDDPLKRYEWACIHKHERKRENYIRLCKKCHNLLDGTNVNLELGRNKSREKGVNIYV